MANNDPNWSSVVLLAHMDGPNDGVTFTDIRGHAITKSGNTVTKTAEKKYGTASAYFDGSGDYLSVATSVDFALGSGDFTIEGWIYPKATSYGYPVFIERGGSWGINEWSIAVDHVSASTKFSVWVYNISSIVPFLVSSSTVSYDSWHHLALSRTGDTWRLFVDGVEEDSDTSSAALTGTSTDTLRVGNGYYGYIDDLRVTNGLGRYTGAFTPSAAAFGDYARYVAGDLTESTDHTDFTVRTHRLDTGAFLNEVTATGSSYECPCCPTATYADYAGPVMVSAWPKLGGTWSAGAAYAAGDYAFPTDPVATPYVFKCTTGGTAHASTEPTWDTSIGNTTSDGTVTWTCQGRMLQPLIHGPITPSI